MNKYTRQLSETIISYAHVVCLLSKYSTNRTARRKLTPDT